MHIPMESEFVSTRTTLRDAFNATLEEHKIPASKIAEISGVSETVISRFRTGKRELTTRVIQQILDALPEKSYQYFLGILGSGAAILEGSEPALKHPSLKDDRDFQRRATETLIANYAAKCTPDEFDNLLGVIADARRLASQRSKFKY